MSARSLKASWVILIIVHSVVTILGLIILVAPTFLLSSEFLSFTGQTWADFTASNTKVSSFFIWQTHEIGVFLFTLGVMSLIITFAAYRKGEKWVWYLFLISNTMGWLGGLAVDLPTGEMGVIMMIVVFFILAYIGLFIGVKNFFKKPTS